MVFKMWCHLFVIYIILVISNNVCSQTPKSTSKNVSPKIDAKKLKEIADLRAELNEALEREAESNAVGGKGVIVQPEWTKSIGKSKGSTKVVVTQKKLDAAAAIRNEIKTAVENNTYVKGESGIDALEADRFLGIHFRSQNLLSNMVGSNHDHYDQEEVGFGFENEVDPTLPNVVQSSAFDDEVDINKLQQLKLDSRRTREILILTEIVEDLSFELGEDVREWEHFEYNNTEYFIGLRDVDLVIVKRGAMKYEKSHVVEVGGPIVHLELLSFWNTQSGQQEGFILTIVGEKVLWFQINSNELFWEWSIGIPIVRLTSFKIDQNDYLAISSKRSQRSGSASISIYQFDIKSREFWIAQKIHLEDECSEIIFLDTGRDIILALALNNSAVIYGFNAHHEVTDHINFKLKSSIPSESIHSICGFQMGGFSYLALGGLSPQILQYANGEFVPKTIFGQNFGLVKMFIAIPARTYRDDLILLVQHRVDFDSHSLVVLDALIWDGEAFEASYPVPCIIGNQTYSYGVGCMVDIQRDSGVKGSAILRRHNDIFLLVPRYKAVSGLFQLKTKLLDKNSELLDLTEIFDFLKEWVKEQDDIVDEAYKFLEESKNNQIDFSNLISLKTPELKFKGDIGQIYINEYEWTEEDMKVDLEYLIGSIEKLDLELGQNDDAIRTRRELTFDTLDFDNVETNELTLQLLNGEQAFVKNSELVFDGTISFESLKVLDEIQMSTARLSREDVLEISDDIQFEEINGIIWNDLINDMVFTNKPLEIGELEVIGDVVVEGDLEIHALNGISFPEDYLWSVGPSASAVRGRKYFLGSLMANAVDTGGLINSVNPFDIITLSEAQNISGLTTFAQLEVSEKMELKEDPEGKGFMSLLSNPSLLDSNIINSACSFEHLEVKGPIFVSEKFNGNDFEATLKDVVYRPSSKDEVISIESKKSFKSVIFDSSLELKENLLSGIPLQMFVTTDTKQALDLNSISGNVYFNSLTITGKYDSIDVVELISNSVKIDDDQTLDLEIEFLDDVWASSIDIGESLNGQNGFRTLQEDFNLEEASFDEVTAVTLKLECDITGEGTLNSVSLNATGSEQSSEIFVEELILEKGLHVDTLNNINTKFLVSFLEKVDNIPAMILDGKLLVDHIHVEGDVQVNKLNAHNFDEDIQMTAIWLNRPNFLQTKIEFQGPLLLNGDLKINGSLNEFDFPALIEDIAFKSESTVVFQSTKRFLSKFKVFGNANIDSVNEHPFTDIATKETIEQFEGTVYIKGDLFVDSLEISDSLNHYPIGSFGKSYVYDENLKSIVLLGEVEFDGQAVMENLHIHGQLNSNGDLNEFFENIVYKNNICMLKGKTTFTGNVTIEKGAYIRNLNGYNVVQLMKNIVFINDPELVVISAPVLFKNVVQAKDVTVKGPLTVTNLKGCTLKEWLADTLRTDRAADILGQLQFAPGVLDGNSMYAVHLNGMDMKNAVTLHTAQNISSHSNFLNVYLADAIQTGGLVNGVVLHDEMENTVMRNGDQHITTPLTMESGTVIQSLEANYLVNNKKDLRNLATLQDDLNIHSPIYFSKVSVENVITNDLISTIDFNQWHQNSLWKEGRPNTIITGNWTFGNLYVKSSIGRDVQKTHTHPYDEIREQYDQIRETSSELCERSNVLFRKVQKRVYFLKHFERSFSLKEDQEINKVFPIKSAAGNYLIVNFYCESKILRWDIRREVFLLISQFESGLIEEIITMPDKDSTFHIVTNTQRKDHECSRLGANSWHFDNEKVVHLRNFNDVDISMIHQSSQTADKFYAIDERTGKVLQLAPNSSEKLSWNLPSSDNGLLRFLPNDADLGIALVNGQQILVLNPTPRRRYRSKRDGLVSRQAQHKFETRTEIPLSKNFKFSDFRQVVEKTLRDLIRRLNIQLTEINFTIFEDELHDEHLRTDFMDILDAIRVQKILPLDTFADLHVEAMEFSSNPIQVLAARVVQIIWPVLGEIEEVHSHLRNNEHDHPICSEIFKSLSSAVHDTLQIAKFYKKSPAAFDQSSNMSEIATRIQDFQKDLLKIIDKLQEEPSHSETLSGILPPSAKVPIRVQLGVQNTTLNPLEEPYIGQPIPEGQLLAADSPYLPARGAGEIVSIKTGMSGNYRTLTVITESKDQVVAGETDSVKIFFDVITGSLFQSLSAYKPNYVATTRIQDESLLAFVEDRSMVRVLTYKGIRGFVEFVKFKVNELVSGLNFLSLSVEDKFECPRHFLIITFHNKVDFYRLIMAGDCSLKGVMQCNAWETY